MDTGTKRMIRRMKNIQNHIKIKLISLMYVA